MPFQPNTSCWLSTLPSNAGLQKKTETSKKIRIAIMWGRLFLTRSFFIQLFLAPPTSPKGRLKVVLNVILYNCMNRIRYWVTINIKHGSFSGWQNNAILHENHRCAGYYFCQNWLLSAAVVFSYHYPYDLLTDLTTKRSLPPLSLLGLWLVLLWFLLPFFVILWYCFEKKITRSAVAYHF